jgi:hypothetical protein
MKIEIDTNNDSKEQIKKAIELLQSVLGDTSEVRTNVGFFDTPSTPEPTPEPVMGGMFAMFGDDNSEPTPHDPNPEPSPNPSPIDPPTTVDFAALQSMNAPSQSYGESTPDPRDVKDGYATLDQLGKEEEEPTPPEDGLEEY